MRPKPRVRQVGSSKGRFENPPSEQVPTMSEVVALSKNMDALIDECGGRERIVRLDPTMGASFEDYDEKLDRAKRAGRYLSAGRGAAKYGLTPEDFAGLAHAQGRSCAICARRFSPDRLPVIDHNHQTGEVRALLCSGCNTALGLMQDCPSILNAAASYLEHFGYYGPTPEDLGMEESA